jgi:DNA-3-methyladenine glycosylase
MLVARDLLGKVLVHTLDGVRYAGRIVETEGYVGPDDAASHARSGQKGRARLMWGPAGVAYVYLIYGMHHCFNAVTEVEGYPGAVLVRAVEPLEGAAEDKGSGPALVCRALRIDRSCNGLDLTSPGTSLAVLDGEALPDTQVRMGPRIGVDYAGPWAAHPWRLWLADSPAVSRKRRGGTLYSAAALRPG